MGKNVRTKAVKELFEAILTLESEEECYDFFEDVCTVNELLSFAQRFEVAKMLTEGHTYIEVAEQTGASTATISRVNRSLNYGKDGYQIVFDRMKERNKK
ncbi:MAG: YerC/YecD family TrpR-related protein [Clostridium sp.]|nr:YerC/YecD family TrpR-related protein [Clostridium sp.]